MAKGYWIAHVRITNPTAYQEYLKLNAVAFAKYGARFLVRGGAYEVAAGARATDERAVVLEFDSYAVAKACHDSPEYQAAIGPRDAGAIVDLIIVDGYAGP